jgi:putative peptide zinc metalloprotease protein
MNLSREDGARDATSAGPTRPDGVRLAGPLQDGGFADSQWLVQRDGRFVQLPELLYKVVELADGSRTLEDIAEGVTATTRWQVASEDVAAIIERKLAPRGLVEGAEPLRPRPTPASALLINARLRVLGPAPVDRIARVLQHLYRPPLLALGLAAVAISHAWMFIGPGSIGPGEAMRDIAASPWYLLVITGLIVLTGIIHEFGHAAALRYGGGRARGMGAGLYLVIPVFYTDVTDSYRLDRRARLRTDLGGFYFHLLAAAALIGAYAITGEKVLLVTAFMIDVDIARQLIPFIRLDGYWVLADLTGIPDLYAHAWPRVKRRLGRGRQEAVSDLRPGVARLFAIYIAVALPAVLALFAYIAWHASAIVRASADALAVRADVLTGALEQGAPGIAAIAALEMALALLPAAGLGALLYVIVRWAAAVARRRAATHQPAATAPRRSVTPVAPMAVWTHQAIQDHLDLKLRHGANPTVVAALEREAFGSIESSRDERVAATAGSRSS